jgi:hypothetical protein
MILETTQAEDPTSTKKLLESTSTPPISLKMETTTFFTPEKSITSVKCKV